MKEPTKADCAGCRDDFYNMNREGGCWSFDSAKMVMARDVPIDMRPPYSFPETLRPSCFHAQGYVRVKKESLTSEGYWK